jgi:N6-L-threonylcarbamoyladenine synthase
MKILGIETSCDETSVAIVDDNKNIISNLISSQIEIHREFGGVVPEIAARSHAEILDKMIKKSLEESNLSFNNLDGIAVTAGPGLIGGVIVGLMMAKAIASVHKKPFLAVNHLEAHALTARLTNNIKFPYLLLLVSGGHCQILLAQGVGKYQKLGSTIDDALGEAFDKVATMLGLEYPGGPKIEKMALLGNENRFNFPKPLIYSEDKFNFSFSGLKTAVRREIERITGSEYDHYSSSKKLSETDICDISASFQRTVTEIIINRLKNIIDYGHKAHHLVNGGGVAANQYIYQKIAAFAKKEYGMETVSPPIALCTDNAAMVAWAGIEKLNLGMKDNLDFKPKARWDL